VAQNSTDAFWASWGADWPSGSTVLPPLFDGRINLTESSSNQDYGWYNSDAVNQAIDAAYLIEDTDARERRGGRSTSRSARTAPSFRWSVRISPTCAVPVLRAIRENQLFGGFPDLATIAVR
jgi:peptide/nickel transport system substrate-binding protein